MEETMNLKDAILLLKQYQGYESFDNGVVLKHSFDLTDETVDTLLSALSVNSIGKPLTLWELEDMEGQKVLLYRMKSTEPLELGTVKQNGDVLGDAGMLAYHELYLETWVAFSHQAQEKPDFEKPLTLEQLRGMERHTPVWAEVENKTIEGWDGYWCLCRRGKILTPSLIVVCAEDLEGVKFYAYPPAHIDREAWTAEWIYPENEFNLPRCSKCGCNSKDAQYSHKDNFCPKCGRAMTQEGRAIMENRLRG